MNMGHEAIKLELIEWLTKLTDDETISYLKAVKDSRSIDHDWWNDLTQDQKASIERGIRDIENGNIVSHEDVKKKYGI